MKKVIVLMAAIVLLAGCANNQLPLSSDSSQLEQSTSSQVSSPPLVVDKGVFGEKQAYYRAVGYNNNQLLADDAANVAAPSTILLFMGDEHDEIGFIYEYGLSLTDEDNNADMPKDEYGNRYLYFGKLQPLEENIYSSSGTTIPSWSVLEGNIKADVDFYVVLNDDKLYLVFKDLSIEDLKNYTSDDYYIFNNYELN